MKKKTGKERVFERVRRNEVEGPKRDKTPREADLEAIKGEVLARECVREIVWIIDFVGVGFKNRPMVMIELDCTELKWRWSSVFDSTIQEPKG